VFAETEAMYVEKLRVAEVHKEADSREKMQILREFRKAQVELSSKVNEMNHMQILMETKEEEHAVLQGKYTASENANTKLHEIVDRKEKEYSTLRDNTKVKMEDLAYQIKQLNSEYTNQQSTIDDLRDSVINKTVSI